MKKVSSAEIWFGGEMGHGFRSGEGVLIMEKGVRERSKQTSPQGRHFQKPLVGKMRGADCHECLQPQRLEDWVLKSQQAWLG